jgi:hypothetical protein
VTGTGANPPGAEPSSTIRCSIVPADPAAAFCTVCHFAFAGRFLSVRPDGRAICHRCARDQGGVLLADTTRVPRDPLLSRGIIHAFGQVLFQPQVSLTQPYRGPVLPAVALGFFATNVGYAMMALWIQILAWDDWMASVRTGVGSEISPDTALALLWLTMPLLATVRFIGGLALFHLGARLAGAPDDSIRTHARVFSLVCLSAFAGVIPHIGWMIALVATTSSIAVFLRASYQFTMLRAVAATLPLTLFVTLVGPHG